MDLPKTDFSGSSLNHSSFISCDLKQADFTECNMENALFTSCHLEKAKLSKALQLNIKVEDNFLKGALVSKEQALMWLNTIGLEITD